MADRHFVVYYSPPSNKKAEEQEVQQMQQSFGSRKDVVLLVVATREKALETIAAAGPGNVTAVIAKAGIAENQEANGLHLLAEIKKANASTFTLLNSYTYSLNPHARLEAVDRYGINMVSHVMRDIQTALTRATAMPPAAVRLDPKLAGDRIVSCPVCGLKGLTSDELWHHFPFYHVNEPNERVGGLPCPVCHKQFPRCPMPVHVFHSHRPKNIPPEGDESNVDLAAFGLAVIQRKKDGKFLLVQEFCNQGYWLPGGRIDAGEYPWRAAERESVEEVGVEVNLTGLLRVEVGISEGTTKKHVRNRYIFYGHPKNDDAEPKTLPDFESAGACWVTADELLGGKLRLRGGEAYSWVKYLVDGGAVHPLNILDYEGAEPPKPAKR